MTSPGRYSNDLGGELAPSVLFGFLSGEGKNTERM